MWMQVLAAKLVDEMRLEEITKLRERIATLEKGNGNEQAPKEHL